MRILIILSLFLTPLLSYSATITSNVSLYGSEGRTWQNGSHNNANNGWPCGEWAGNVFCYSMPTYELNDWCSSYPSGGPPWANNPACGRIVNGGIRQGYPLVIGFEPGAIYDKSSSCQIKITVSNTVGAYYGTGSLVGFTQSSASITSSNGVRGFLAEFRATFSNCREAMMDLGIKHGYGTNWNYKSVLGTGNPVTRLCIYVDNQSLGCNTAPGSTVPPQPAACNINVPLTLDYGVINSIDVSGAQRDITIDYQCNKSATVSFSLLDATPINSGVAIDMGEGLTSELCFLSGNDCPSSGGANVKVTGVTGSVKLRSTLKGSDIRGGAYSSHVTVVSAFY
ncbi:hypothetical protein [Providencia sp. PROV223]|uniref:hypothetical protein n=1 Tax=Providencia sp. PROV223 TaxID=2949917 RepID=UPI00234A277E|nr:hypothetical protein [Providencia sp. PROV223]